MALKRTANLSQRLAFLLIERADEVVVAVVVAVLVPLAEAAVIGDTQNVSYSAVICSREASDGVRSGFGDIDFHSKYRLRCHPEAIGASCRLFILSGKPLYLVPTVQYYSFLCA